MICLPPGTQIITAHDRMHEHNNYVCLHVCLLFAVSDMCVCDVCQWTHANVTTPLKVALYK